MFDISLERAREQLVRIVGSGKEVTSGQIPFTPRAKRVLELAQPEAANLGHNYIGTEHLLLGLVRERSGVGARILLDFDADAEKIRNEVTRMLTGSAPVALPGTPPAFVAWLGRALTSTASEAQGDAGRAVDGGDFLLALARERDGVAARALADLGIHERELRGAVRRARLPHDDPG